MSHPDGEHWMTDGRDFDHLMQKGDGECDTFEPRPRGQFNDMPRGTSYYCKTCTHGEQCASGGLIAPDPAEEDYEADPRYRRVYKFGSL